MKTRFFPPFKDEGEVIAFFGQARLVKYLDGKVELLGGSAEDHTEAREWISMFWHEVVGGNQGSRAHHNRRGKTARQAYVIGAQFAKQVCSRQLGHAVAGDVLLPIFFALNSLSDEHCFQ